MTSTYEVDGCQIRLCTTHVKERRDRGDNVRVPILDHMAFIAVNTGRDLGERPCIDCVTGNPKGA